MFGKYNHTVDAKGRLFVPSKLRDELGEVFYVTIGLDDCLSVYPTEKWGYVHLDIFFDLALFHLEDVAPRSLALEQRAKERASK